MDTAGYRLAGIDTSGNVLAHVDYRFVQERTPSADDLDRVRRGLALHRARYGGAMAAVQGRVLQGVLAVADTPGFRVTAVDIEVLPWPSAVFHLTAADRPLTAGEQQILNELRQGGGASTP